MELLGYLASLFVGVSLGMIGGGGSILTVPILVYFFAIHPLLATAYSLFIVGSTALVGGMFYLKRGEVDVRAGFTFALPSFVGVYVTRAILVPALPDPVFTLASFAITKALLIMVLFAVLMIFASLSMIRPSAPRQTRGGSQNLNTQKMSLIGAKGLFVGSVTGLVGAGGGFLIIPALVILVGLPMRVAVGTSLLIIAANSLLGFTGDLLHQVKMDWHLLLSVAGIALAGLFVGLSLSKKVPEATLKKGFGYFVLIMGVFILADQLRR